MGSGKPFFLAQYREEERENGKNAGSGIRGAAKNPRGAAVFGRLRYWLITI